MNLKVAVKIKRVWIKNAENSYSTRNSPIKEVSNNLIFKQQPPKYPQTFHIISLRTELSNIISIYVDNLHMTITSHLLSIYSPQFWTYINISHFNNTKLVMWKKRIFWEKKYQIMFTSFLLWGNIICFGIFFCYFVVNGSLRASFIIVGNVFDDFWSFYFNSFDI